MWRGGEEGRRPAEASAPCGPAESFLAVVAARMELEAQMPASAKSWMTASWSAFNLSIPSGAKTITSQHIPQL